MYPLHLTRQHRADTRSIVRRRLESGSKARAMLEDYGRLTAWALEEGDVREAKFWARCFALTERVDHLQDCKRRAIERADR